jgi:hypothetical protein
MADKKTLMYSDSDIELIKATFAENDFLLISVRKLFFGAVLTEEEKNSIKQAFKDPKVIEVLRRKIYPVFNPTTPVGQISDPWLGVEEQIFGASRDTISQAVNSKAIAISMFEQAFDSLANPDGEQVSIQFDPLSINADELAINLIARNLYMKAIETGLLGVKMIAGKKDETIEQTLARLQQDSSK